MRRTALTCLVALGLALSVGSTAYAQVYTGTIAGRVTDQTGAVLPGVTVTITSDVLIQPESAVTSETGSYRFAELAIGTYTVTFELPGFQTLIREGIILTAGSTQTINGELGIAELQETITVSGESPVVDVRQTGIPESFENERLENIPTARDPWVILEQTPGMLMDRQNVGGNESGQQSTFINRGTAFGNNTWNYDGVNITDNAANGSSPMYFDFGAFEEMSISTGGQDPSLPTAGTGINFIIKQGTNQLKGQGQFYGNHSSLQSDNITDELREQGAGAGAPIKYILDYGFDIGGPIIRDRAWLWGDYGVQDIHKGAVGFLVPGCDDPDDVNCQQDDPTNLKNANIKFNLQLAPNNKFNFLWAYNNKTRATRGAADTRPLETTWQQRGPVHIYKFEDTHIASENLLFTGRFAYVDGGFGLFRQDPSQRDVQPTYDYDTGNYTRSYWEYETVRPTYVGNFDGNWFVTNVMGGDHEFKFGYQYKRTPIDSFTTYGGDAWAVYDAGTPVEAWLNRSGIYSYAGQYHALHFQDIITSGNMTLKIGFRYDYQSGWNKPSSIPASMVVPEFLPGIDFEGTEKVAWNTISPRLGFTYDLTGDGRTIIRASYGRFYDLLDLWENVGRFNPATGTEVDVPWTDLNNDGFIQGNEVDLETIYWFSNYNQEDPGSAVSTNVRDPDTKAPTTDEIILGFERELVPDFSFGANFIYKKFANMFFFDWFADNTDGTTRPFPSLPPGTQQNAWIPVTEEFEGQTVTYYDLAEGFSRDGDLLTNRPDYDQVYRGFEITGRKRLSNRWMMNFGLTLASHKENYGEAAIYDPTNGAIREGSNVAFSSVFMNSTWNFKLDGMYQLPGGFNIAGKLNGRQGYIFPLTFRSDNRSGGIGRTEVLLEPFGDSRLDNLWYVDLRLEKMFTFDRYKLSLMVDGFNMTNAAPVLERERRQNMSNANKIRDILSGRIFRFGVRFNF
jgi:hypothetical protein